MVKELQDGGQKKFIIRYLPSQDWYYQKNRDLKNYSGKIKIYDMEGNISGNMLLEHGVPISQDEVKLNDQVCTYRFDIMVCSQMGAPFEGQGSCIYYYELDGCSTGGGGDSADYTEGTMETPNYEGQNWTQIPSGGSNSPDGNDSGNEEDDDIESPPLIWEDLSGDDDIDDNDLDPCLKTIMDTIQGHYHGVGKVLAQFNDNTLQNYNWIVKSGIIGGSIIGQTDTQYNVSQNIATTTFDSRTFNNASDLSWVKTILHESVHAYVLTVAYDESLTQAEKNALFGPNYLSAYINGGHTFIATQYLNSMADVLQEYAEFKGYYPYGNDLAKNREFYKDLAWGGLGETAEWDQLSSSTKSRILNRIAIEATGKDLNGNTKTQKGENAGC